METKITMDKDVAFIEIKNDKNLEVTLCSFGASLYKVMFKGKNRIMTPLNHEEFYKNEQYYGKAIGRFSGRINDAECRIEDKTYTLPKNWNGINSLHGGPKGISFSNFSYEIAELYDSIDVIFTFTEMESYLPGDVAYQITYRVFKETDDIRMDIRAYASKETIVNVTNHAYWSLSSGKRNVLDEELTLACNKYADEDMNLIAKAIVPVNKTMDFRLGKKIGEDINDPVLQNHTSFGYDHFFLKEDPKKDFVARLSDKEEDVILSIYTSYPAVVMYTDNYPTKMEYDGCPHEEKYQAIALECQYVPNGINMNGVNKALLAPGDRYSEYILWSFL